MKNIIVFNIYMSQLYLGPEASQQGNTGEGVQ